MVWGGPSALPRLGQGSAFPALGLSLVPEQGLGEAPGCRCGFCTPGHLWFIPAGTGSAEALSVHLV